MTIYVYVCMYVCTYALMYVCICVCVYVCVCMPAGLNLLAKCRCVRGLGPRRQRLLLHHCPDNGCLDGSLVYIYIYTHTYLHIMYVCVYIYGESTYPHLDVLVCTYAWMAGWMDGWTDGWLAGWLDGWMDSRMNFSVFVGVAICTNRGGSFGHANLASWPCAVSNVTRVLVTLGLPSGFHASAGHLLRSLLSQASGLSQSLPSPRDES